MRDLVMRTVQEDKLRELIQTVCDGVEEGGGFGAACSMVAEALCIIVGDPLYVHEYLEDNGTYSEGTVEIYRKVLKDAGVWI